MLFVIPARRVSTTGDSPLTVIVSASDATFKPTRRSVVPPTDTRKSVSSYVLNPLSTMDNEYAPGGSRSKRYSPRSLVTVVAGPPGRFGGVSVAVEAGSNPPDSSCTAPMMLPVEICACTECASNADSTTNMNVRTLMWFPPWAPCDAGPTDGPEAGCWRRPVIARLTGTNEAVCNAGDDRWN